MRQSLNNQTNQIETGVAKLLSKAPELTNHDLHSRVVIQSHERVWQASNISGLSICILEFLGKDTAKMTALLKFESDEHKHKDTPRKIEISADNLELLTQHGVVADDEREYTHPLYLRQPSEKYLSDQTISLLTTLHSQIEFYIAAGQIAPDDKQRRCINLADDTLWLPGPVKQTEVLPLHMHEGNNSMLVRWNDEAGFKPKLDPRGEEVFILNGKLRDKHGEYDAGSWIRNPISAWQEWTGTAGTTIYYKNGHFDHH